MKRIVSPYRICPIGAHVDHQGGVVLGRTIQLGTRLDYEPLDSNEIQIVSEQFGEAKFSIGDLDRAHWARYAQAAARVLNAKRGMRAQVSGDLIGSGLSSSAAVGLAYLKALADVNAIELSKRDLVNLDYELEHGQLGLQNGLLDPLTIVNGRRDALLFMDTLTASVTPLPDSRPGDFVWLVAYSGVSRELTKSGFNVRVEECRQAASRLKQGAQILSDVSRETYEDKKMTLPHHLRKRAEHFFGEVDRVQRGAQAWRDADPELFGGLMNQSCESSIRNYESGSEILIELHELVSSTNGIYGSRFSGGGYGGCVVALAKRDLAEEACLKIAGKFSTLHSDLPSKVFIAETGDGLSPSRAERSDSVVEAGAGTDVMIKSAVLLAAGRGQRQRPYTDETPKALLPARGRPTLDYVLRAVERASFERICIVTHHLEEKIIAYVGDGSRWNLNVTFAHQNELGGSGDALMSVPKDWIRNEPLMVLATDYILEENALLELIEAHKQHGAEMTMGLKECPLEELVSRSSVEVDSEWRVKRLIEKPAREQIMSPYAASILFILPPSIWEYLPRIQPSPRGEIEMQSAVQMMIEDGFNAYGLLQSAPAEWKMDDMVVE